MEKHVSATIAAGQPISWASWSASVLHVSNMYPAVGDLLVCFCEQNFMLANHPIFFHFFWTSLTVQPCYFEGLETHHPQIPWKSRLQCSTWWLKHSMVAVSQMIWIASSSTPMRPSGSASGINYSRVCPNRTSTFVRGCQLDRLID